jgi:hypothetical protein
MQLWTKGQRQSIEGYLKLRGPKALALARGDNNMGAATKAVASVPRTEMFNASTVPFVSDKTRQDLARRRRYVLLSRSSVALLMGNTHGAEPGEQKLPRFNANTSTGKSGTAS